MSCIDTGYCIDRKSCIDKGYVFQSSKGLKGVGRGLVGKCGWSWRVSLGGQSVRVDGS